MLFLEAAYVEAGVAMVLGARGGRLLRKWKGYMLDILG